MGVLKSGGKGSPPRHSVDGMVRCHRIAFREIVANRKEHEQDRLREAAAKRKPQERMFSPRINKRSVQIVQGVRERVRFAQERVGRDGCARAATAERPRDLAEDP